MNKISSYKLDNNVIKVFISYIWNSKIVIASYVFCFILCLIPLLLFIGQKDFNIVYMENNIMFAVIPYISQLIFITFITIRLFVSSKNNNIDLYASITKNSKYGIFFMKQLTLLMIGLLTLLFPVVIYSSLIYLKISSGSTYFFNILWSVAHLVIMTFIITSIVSFAKKFITSFGIAIISSFLFIVSMASPLFIQASKKNEVVDNSYKVFNVSSMEKAADEEYAIIGYNPIKQYHIDDKKILNYIPSSAFYGITSNISTSLKNISMNQEEKLLSDNSPRSSISIDVVYEEPISLKINESTAVIRSNEKNIFNFNSNAELFITLEHLLINSLGIKTKSSQFWNSLYLNINSSQSIGNTVLTTEEKKVILNTIGVNDSLLKQWFLYRKLMLNTESKFFDYLEDKKYSEELIKYLKYIITNENIRFEILKLNSLGLKQNYYYPSLKIHSEHDKSSKYDLIFVSNILFKPEFDKNENLLKVNYLNKNDFYSEMSDWKNSLIINGTGINNKTEWNDYFENNSTLSNLENIVYSVRRKHNDLTDYHFEGNQYDNLLADKKYTMNANKEIGLVPWIYLTTFITVAIALQIIIKYKLNRKDIL